MPRIAEERFFGGVQEKVARLGLTSLVDEVRSILTGFTLLIEEATPRLRDGVRTVEDARAQNLPIMLIAIQHDGVGRALPKKNKRP